MLLWVLIESRFFQLDCYNSLYKKHTKQTQNSSMETLLPVLSVIFVLNVVLSVGTLFLTTSHGLYFYTMNIVAQFNTGYHDFKSDNFLQGQWSNSRSSFSELRCVEQICVEVNCSQHTFSSQSYLPTLSVKYFDQLLGAARLVHVVYLAQLLGAVLFIHLISNHHRINKQMSQIPLWNRTHYTSGSYFRFRVEGSKS